MGSILQEYKRHQLSLEKKYGNQSIVLMQVGSFYEIYSVDTNRQKFGKTVEVTKVLNILQTKKNKSLPHSESNPYMAGFPVHSLGKHLLKLINSSFTVAMYDQFDGHVNKKIRKLVNIYSPSTYLDNEMENSKCMGINVTEYKCPIQKRLIKECSIVIIDISTGKNEIFTCTDTIDFPNHVGDEISRIMQTVRPCEIVHNYKDNLFKGYLNHYLELDKKFENVEYQNKFLKKIFKENIQDLQLEKYPAIITCYLYTLQFIHHHDPRIITRIQKPVFLTTSTDLLLNTDALTQLHIIPHKDTKTRFKSLLDIIDFTQTKMGYRLLKSRLFYPCKDVKMLESRYDAIDKMLVHQRYKSVQNQLQGIGDIEKKYRKLSLLRLQPYEFAKLNYSFEKILILLKGHKLEPSFTEFFSDYKHTFHLEKMATKESFFKESIDPVIEKKIENIKHVLKTLAYEMGKQIEQSMSNLIRLEETERDGFFLSTTKKRWEIFMKKNNKDRFVIGSNTFETEKFIVKKMASGMRICHPLFDKYWGYYKKLESNFKILLNKKYLETLERYHAYSNTFQDLITFIAELDVYASLAKASIKYNYSRPKILSPGPDHSFIKAIKIRHPLIERVQDDKEYITNDITIEDGIILYGVNAGGKSSLLRAVGANVIMAQMGAFVACESFEYYPFHHLLTKIASTDNLFKGQSTFVYEMLELKRILSVANRNSLILCDELTAGTETQSATGIVASAIQVLLGKDAHFLFTTHLHGLLNFSELIEHPRLKIYHFKILINAGKIIYHYSLEPGSGDSIYGIEIAKALGLDLSFIEGAFAFRAKFSKTYSTSILHNKRSRYNRKVIMDQCDICCTNENLQTHHINEQCKANENGFINHFHKNMKHNLQILCGDCHRKQH